jgi:hypothetical protein
MTDLRTAAQQALEALEFMADEWGFTQKANRPERWQAIDALRAALKQPEQKPVAWRFKRLVNQDFETDWVLTKYEPPNGVNVVAIEPLFTRPPRREWRGLTDEQLLYVYNELPNWGMDMDSLSPKLKQFARAVEAALKERNA